MSGVVMAWCGISWGVSQTEEDASTWGDLVLIWRLHLTSCRCGSWMWNKAFPVRHVVTMEDSFMKMHGFFMSSWTDVRGYCTIWSHGDIIWWWCGMRFRSAKRCHLVEARMTCAMHAGSCGVLFPWRGETAHLHDFVRTDFHGATSWRNLCGSLVSRRVWSKSWEVFIPKDIFCMVWYRGFLSQGVEGG